MPDQITHRGERKRLEKQKETRKGSAAYLLIPDKNNANLKKTSQTSAPQLSGTDIRHHFTDFTAIEVFNQILVKNRKRK